MDHEDIIERAAEAIMQRANDTYPRTLHKDMLRDEIGKAIKEATKPVNWPPPVALGEWPTFIEPPYYIVCADPVTTSHDRMRTSLKKPK